MNKQNGKFKTKFNNIFGEIETIKHEEEIEEVIETTSEEIIKPVEEEVKEDIKQKIKEASDTKKEEVIEKETIKPVEKNKKEEVIETTSEETKETPNRKKRNYYIPVEMLEDMKKVVYMDRELGGNYTELVLTALRQYLDTKKDLINEYDKLKDIK